MDLELKGRHIVVTGGTGALGSAVVGLLIEGGATCHIPSFRGEELRDFPYTGQCRVAEGVDLTEEEAVQGFYERFEGAGSPGLWASIHTAGGFAMAGVESTSAADFSGQMRMNALTCFLCCREAVRRMKGRGGRIVNIAARPGVAPELGAGMVAYTASKAAVAAITRAVAAEVADDGVLVNTVVPSIMDTPSNRRAMPSADHSRWPRVEEVAATIAFLVSPRNAVTSGGWVPVYGKS